MRVSRILCSTGFLPIPNYVPFSMNSTISAHPLTFLRPIPSLKWRNIVTSFFSKASSVTNWIDFLHILLICLLNPSTALLV